MPMNLLVVMAMIQLMAAQARMFYVGALAMIHYLVALTRIQFRAMMARMLLCWPMVMARLMSLMAALAMMLSTLRGQQHH